MPGSEPFFGVPGFQVGRSLRFNDGDTPELTRTFTTAGNRRTFTYSVWVKRSDDGAGGINHTLFDTAAGDGIHIRAGSNAPAIQINYGTDKEVVTNAIFRDKAAWYHIVVAIDTTQGTDTNRIKVYVNGVQQTFSAANYPNQNVDGHFNNAVVHKIGRQAALARYFDGYMAEINFIDGLALGPTYFGTTDPAAGNGQWLPTKYSGAYGNNGFYLPFKGYGIAAATGGTITTDGDYKVHSFTSNGTFEVTSITNTDPSLTGAATAEIEYLIIGGGGAGAGNSTDSGAGGAGGGGAGAYRPGSALLTAQTYAVVVGAGGTGTTYAANPAGDQGDDSSAFGITAEGGGSGGSYGYPVTGYGDNGSGGGGQGKSDGSAHAGGTGGQFGNDGGDGHAGGTAGQPNYGAGGGGGSSAPGADGSGSAGGAGGAGTASSITGSSVTRAGGGGGSTRNNQGTQGTGSGGGGDAGQSQGGNASANTGAGGGGAHHSGATSTGGDGGSGIVIIRYKFQ
jgi:hypothetical protein